MPHDLDLQHPGPPPVDLAPYDHDAALAFIRSMEGLTETVQSIKTQEATAAEAVFDSWEGRGKRSFTSARQSARSDLDSGTTAVDSAIDSVWTDIRGRLHAEQLHASAMGDWLRAVDEYNRAAANP